ncbi:hypothetical protein SERLA73DRAFT_161479 [Serpula lacrymans var. lacrymans S7.3]|uniref:C2H2-type domain-containing protein n=1 Tax=Serpula lacrymans var. lacrymans (strain S7.3) TaxID=936435 RepID=F8Q2M8_SERL3|nr:hypothetical protein SERLA73DRAFT_161479 [Serpula lacrymans var. lacrymans S7.3]
MAATSQPIAFPSSSHSNDYTMASGSYTGANGSFNAASYTRHYLGSPLSWRAGSFGSRIYPSCSPGQLIAPLDTTDFKCGKLSSSLESDRGSIINALSAFEREDELCRNYTCCGHTLNDLHALLEHFEEVHVVVVDPYAPHQSFPVVPNPPHQLSGPPPSYFPDPHQLPPSNYHQEGPFDPDDMELDVDQSPPSSGGPSPPDTPLSTPLSSHPIESFNTYSVKSTSACPSPHLPVSAFDTTTVLPSRSRSFHGQSIPLTAFPPSRTAGMPSAANTPEAFNAYAGYSDYSSSMPGTVPSPPASDEQMGAYPGSEPGSPYPGCVPPALLFSSTTTATPANTPAISRVPSPSSGASSHGGAMSTGASSSTVSSPHMAVGAGLKSPCSTVTPRASTTLSRPASSLLLSKPFRCPKTNCNKSYKQANGLKYHMTHGSCNFAPPKDLEQVQALLASKRSAREAAGEDDAGISEGELREVEREAERRLRPFACGVGECQRRYKNMNGLRYHYQHSGDHGAVGLALLASGQHECLQHAHGKMSAMGASASVSAASSRQSTPLASGQTTPMSGGTTTGGAGDGDVWVCAAATAVSDAADGVCVSAAVYAGTPPTGDAHATATAADGVCGGRGRGAAMSGARR